MGTYLVGYDVLRSYLHSFLHSRRPLYTFYQTFCDVYLDHGNANIYIALSYNKLRMAGHNVNFNIGFNCPDCGDLPGTIICDGTSLLTEYFLEPASLRSNLKRYICGVMNGVLNRNLWRKKKRKQLLEGIKHVSESLYNLLLELEEDNNLIPVYKDLIICLASPSRVCRTLRPSEDVRQVLDGLADHESMPVWGNAPLWQSLRQHVRILILIYESRLFSSNLLPLLQEISIKNIQDIQLYHLAFSPSFVPMEFVMVMECHESPNVPFSILRTRFRQAPKVVIYDNACKLHDYCISRDPFFFQDTEFYIDRLHWDNHTSCSLAYNISLYPQYQHLNSQCNAQANAGLKRIKDQLSYMTAKNFMVHCSLYLWNKNRLIKEKLVSLHPLLFELPYGQIIFYLLIKLPIFALLIVNIELEKVDNITHVDDVLMMQLYDVFYSYSNDLSP
ncbi:LOW QUALITY PROTEIN: hypothetical protein KUTeg_011299 [Tegillarca granosa]|uniref:Uncharacterized protein n=1 Tax=Tegillarca granosa TaxID=220873 RepID=A0ABQ9F176_TEGGR|nr:LOW QUALITY PROTEIN: hypothetical protein KUTeg_011299 [Tegillarca granosa]